MPYASSAVSESAAGHKDSNDVLFHQVVLEKEGPLLRDSCPIFCSLFPR